jgi:hypothetical protein
MICGDAIVAVVAVVPFVVNADCGLAPAFAGPTGALVAGVDLRL